MAMGCSSRHRTPSMLWPVTSPMGPSRELLIKEAPPEKPNCRRPNPFGYSPTHLPLRCSEPLRPPVHSHLVVSSFPSLSPTPTLRPNGVCASRLPREGATTMPTLRTPQRRHELVTYELPGKEDIWGQEERAASLSRLQGWSWDRFKGRKNHRITGL